jgi:hypothetical protein
VTVSFSNGTKHILTEEELSALSVDSSAFDEDTVGTYTIIVSYQGVNFPYNVTVIDPAATVAKPQASPSGGIFTGEVTITLSSATEGAEIWYTLDNTTPTQGTGTSIKYISPFSITETATLKAIAFFEDLEPSSVLEALYTVNPPEASGVEAKYRFSGGEWSSFPWPGKKLREPFQRLPKIPLPLPVWTSLYHLTAFIQMAAEYFTMFGIGHICITVQVKSELFLIILAALMFILAKIW